MIPRNARRTLRELSKGFPVVSVTGPRQSGKTTLVRAAFPEMAYFSLEDPDLRQLVAEDPRGFLGRYRRGLILDEAQRSPEMFSYLQTIVDEDPRPGRFILTGSQQFGLLAGITQSLAGRVGILQLLPFALSELQSAGRTFPDLDEVLLRGLYPALYDRKVVVRQWHSSYVMTYVERDLRQILNIRELGSFQRFLRMCAARVGQLLNLSSLAIECGISHNTARSWLSVLEASYLVFLLQPHFRNFGKRLVKTPKLYFFDPGVAAFLLNIQSADHLSLHSLRGALFECLVVSELVKSRLNKSLPSNLYFWRNNTGEELDLIIDQGERLIPVEIKSGETLGPDQFRGLERWRTLSGSPTEGYLVYGGREEHRRGSVRVVPWRDIGSVRQLAE